MFRKVIIMASSMVAVGVLAVSLYSHVGRIELIKGRAAFDLSGWDETLDDVDGYWAHLDVNHGFLEGEYRCRRKPRAIPFAKALGYVGVEVEQHQPPLPVRSVPVGQLLAALKRQQAGTGVRAWSTTFSAWLGFPFLLLAAYPAIAFVRGPLRRHRRRAENLCAWCGYDLRGLPEARCPECGTRFGGLEAG